MQGGAGRIVRRAAGCWQLRTRSLWITYTPGPELVVWWRRRRLLWLRWPPVEYRGGD